MSLGSNAKRGWLSSHGKSSTVVSSTAPSRPTEKMDAIDMELARIDDEDLEAGHGRGVVVDKEIQSQREDRD
jgi:hypothetical protein